MKKNTTPPAPKILNEKNSLFPATGLNAPIADGKEKKNPSAVEAQDFASLDAALSSQATQNLASLDTALSSQETQNLASLDTALSPQEAQNLASLDTALSPQETQNLASLHQTGGDDETMNEAAAHNPTVRGGQGGAGILILALGAPEYGRMAANLASSIRYADANIKIHLVWSGQSISHLTPKHKALFTSMAECPVEFYTKPNRQPRPHPKSFPEGEGLQNPLLAKEQDDVAVQNPSLRGGQGGACYLKAKTCMYELSPFDETIFLDADMIWFSNPHRKNASTLFEELKGLELTFQNRGYFDLHHEKLDENYSNWCNIAEVKAKYFTGEIAENKGRFYHLHSEFVYFTRSASNQQFFDLCRQIFDDPKVKPAVFDGDIPDELAFDIAVAVTGKNPHRDNFLPIHWFAMDGSANISQLQNKYYGLSMGGNNLPKQVAEKYKMLARFYARHFGLPYSFSIHPKKRWSPGRKNA